MRHVAETSWRADTKKMFPGTGATADSSPLNIHESALLINFR